MNVTVIIAGREAIPVRAIPHVTRRAVAPDTLCICLGHEDVCKRLLDVSVYQIQPDGSSVPFPPTAWDAICASLQDLSTNLKAKEKGGSSTRQEWRQQSPLKLPAGVFVWRDEFEPVYRRQWKTHFDIRAMERRDEGLGERAGERDLFLDSTSAERQVFVEGFESVSLSSGPDSEAHTSDGATKQPNDAHSGAPEKVEPEAATNGDTQAPILPDWDLWQFMPNVAIWQFCALSLNLDPDSLEIQRGGWMYGPDGRLNFESLSFPSKELASTFGKRYRILDAQDDCATGRNNNEAKLAACAAWAVFVGWDIPDELSHLAFALQKPEGTPAPQVPTEPQEPDATTRSGATEDVALPSTPADDPEQAGGQEPDKAALPGTTDNTDLPVPTAGDGKSKGMDRNRILAAFFPVDNHERWSKTLSDPPGWLVHARIFQGRPGISALWNPAEFAIALHRKGVIKSRSKLTRVMGNEFSGWLPEWTTYVASLD